jgi:prephenate dehydrogenase
VAAAAQARGAIDEVGEDPDAAVVFVATPLGPVAEVARAVLARPGRRADQVVTDVAGVKVPVVGAVDDATFVGGHPMAGSEQLGVAGATADLFAGATWVLTPTEVTDAGAFARLRQVVSSLGAEVLALAPEQHDALVAVVSHVPHLTAAALMNLADTVAERHGALTRLAAGGFRDMTRVAAGHPAIWPDVCAENAVAIVATLGDLIEALTAMRRRVADGDRTGLYESLEHAAHARRALPAGVTRIETLAEVRVPVPDRPGVLASVTTMAGELGINIHDLEIAHSVEGDYGVMVLVVDDADVSRFCVALAGLGFHAVARSLE